MDRSLFSKIAMQREGSRDKLQLRPMRLLRHRQRRAQPKRRPHLLLPCRRQRPAIRLRRFRQQLHPRLLLKAHRPQLRLSLLIHPHPLQLPLRQPHAAPEAAEEAAEATLPNEVISDQVEVAEEAGQEVASEVEGEVLGQEAGELRRKLLVLGMLVRQVRNKMPLQLLLLLRPDLGRQMEAKAPQRWTAGSRTSLASITSPVLLVA